MSKKQRNYFFIRLVFLLIGLKCLYIKTSSMGQTLEFEEKLFLSSDLENRSCKQTFNSRNAKSGVLQTSQLLPFNTNSLTVQCRYEFYANNANERIQITFRDFNMSTESKNMSNCKLTESLQLLVAGRSKYEVADLFCGAFIPKPILSDGPTLFLQFNGKIHQLESSRSFYGFKAEYEFLTNFGITTGIQIDENCTFAYNSSHRKSGWFATPNFPGFYPKNIVCNYFFYGEPNEKILIHFTSFEVEGVDTCEHATASDFVEFSNFISMDRKFPRYCGKREQFDIRSDSHFFRITFYSNDRFDKIGFRALYDFEKENLTPENSSMQSFVSSKAAVNNKCPNRNTLSILLFVVCVFNM